MSWIKRNLFFVIGSLIALGLLGWAGFYNFSRLKLNTDARAKLNDQYKELKRLNDQNPHPGNGKVDNISAARQHKDMLTNVIVQASRLFRPIPSIPPPDKLTSQDFAAALRQTIDQLQRQALNASVTLPPLYGFSFSVERTVLSYTPGSLAPLSAQLGEIKAICDVFNEAKVNSLDNIRRERVCQEDMSPMAPVADYLDIPSRTNDLAVLSPYEISFRCFSPELAQVLAEFASSPHGFIVRSVNVEPAAAVTAADAYAPGQYYPPQYGVRPPGTEMDNPDALYMRQARPPPTMAPAPAATRGGLQTVIDERQLRITMVVEVVKLLPGR
jgi:hypothetical protein